MRGANVHRHYSKYVAVSGCVSGSVGALRVLQVSSSARLVSWGVHRNPPALPCAEHRVWGEKCVGGSSLQPLSEQGRQQAQIRGSGDPRAILSLYIFSYPTAETRRSPAQSGTLKGTWYIWWILR